MGLTAVAKRDPGWSGSGRGRALGEHASFARLLAKRRTPRGFSLSLWDEDLGAADRGVQGAGAGQARVSRRC